MRNSYRVYLDSTKAISASTKDQSCEFSLNLGGNENYDKGFCYVRMSYFNIKKTGYTTISAILVKLNNSAPNTYITKTIDSNGNQNLVNDNIIGIVGTGSTSYSYSSEDYVNDYVRVGNIFNGNIVISLYSQDNVILADAKSDEWVMVLDVYFDNC